MVHELLERSPSSTAGPSAHSNAATAMDRAVVTDVTGPITGLTRADLMTAAEVANLLGVPVSTIRHSGRAGLFPRIKLGRHVRFIRAHVKRVLFDAEQRLPR